MRVSTCAGLARRVVRPPRVVPAPRALLALLAALTVHATAAPSADPVVRGLADSLWFGGIDENGLATQGGIWDFEDGTLQGWTSTDLTAQGDWFRHVTIDSCDAHVADGCPVITDGGSTGSMWLGAFEGEARAGCWPGGQGYDSLWSQELRRTYTYDGSGDVTLTFDYFVDSETQFDYTFLYVDADGVRTVPLNTSAWSTPEGWGYSGAIDEDTGIASPDAPAHEEIVLGPDELPPGTETFTVAFVFESDRLYSDGFDSFSGFLNSRHGPFGVDDVRVMGGGINDLSDFEPTGVPGEERDGWTSHPAPGIGAYLAAVPLADLDPPDVTGECPVDGTVMVAAVRDGSDYPHPRHQWEELISNPLHVGPGSPAHASGLDRWLVRWDSYEDLPGSVGVGYLPSMHYYPWTCPETGVVGWTLQPVGHAGYVYTTSPRCGPRILDDTEELPSGIDSVRVVIRLLAACDTGGFCEGQEFSNLSPYLDNLQIGLTEVIGVDDAEGAPTAGHPGILGVHPNPMRSATTLRYAIDARTRVRVDVLDVTGRVVIRLLDDAVDPGVHTVRWELGAADARSGDGGRIAPGVYWMRLETGSDVRASRRVVVMAR